MHDVIILAAGCGRRFHQLGDNIPHKSLAPIWDERGTLELLLSQLKAAGLHGQQIWLTTGFAADAVVSAAQRVYPTLNIIHNTDFATDSLFHSLQKAIAAITDKSSAVWVLFADTLYSQEMLKRLMQLQADIPAAALMQLPSDEPTNVPVHADELRKSQYSQHFSKELKVKVAHGHISAFNQEASQSTHCMAHAVYWPRAYFPTILQAPSSLNAQWQLLASVPATTYVCVPPYSAQDIDTAAQLQQLRPNISDHVYSYFQLDLNKDARNFIAADSLAGDDGLTASYLKRCENPEAAHHEAQVLKLLQQQAFAHVPNVYAQHGEILSTEVIHGIRFYDLLRQLTPNEQQQKRVRQILTARCHQRLTLQQQYFRTQPQLLAQPPYPFAVKVTQLLEALCSLLRLPPPPADELAELAALWPAYCTVPFRDATPKNIIIAADEVRVTLTPTARRQALTELLSRPEHYWREVPIVDIDFTSTYHLTCPLDDFISLHGHACNVVNNPFFQQIVATPSTELDLALLVRYLRFGGRKLMYLLVNPQGFRQRFRYDDPTYYIAALTKLLSADFTKQYPKLVECLRQIRDKAAIFEGFEPTPMAYDYCVQQHAVPQHYWQESPLELSVSANYSTN